MVRKGGKEGRREAEEVERWCTRGEDDAAEAQSTTGSVGVGIEGKGWK